MSDTETPRIILNQDGFVCELYGETGEYIYDLIASTKDFYEGSLLRALHAVYSADKDAVIVDVGANIGNHTVYFGKVIGAPVVAIEPVYQNLSFLKKNVAANDLQDRVEVLPVAAWHQDEVLNLSQNIENNSGTYQVTEDGSVSTQGKKIDDLIGDRNVSLLKIDVEGSEEQVLQGAQEVIARNRPMIILEAHSPKAIQDHRNLLGPLDYQLVGVLGRSDNYVWTSDARIAGKVRDEMSVVRHRSEQRKLNSSLAQQSKSLNQLQTQITQLQRVVSSNAKVLEDNGQKNTDSMSELNNRLQEKAPTVMNVRLADIVSQVTQLTLEIGKNSAGINFNTTELQRFDAKANVIRELLNQTVKNTSPVSTLSEMQLHFKTQLEQVLDGQDRITESSAFAASQLKDMSSMEEAVHRLDERVSRSDANLANFFDSLAQVFVVFEDDLKDASRSRESQNGEMLKLAWALTEVSRRLAFLEEKYEGTGKVVGESTSTFEDDMVSQLARTLRSVFTNLNAYIQNLYDVVADTDSRLLSIAQEKDQALAAYESLLGRYYGPESRMPTISDTHGITVGHPDVAEMNRTSDPEESAIKSGVPGTHLPRQRNKYRQRVRVGVASMPGREKTLAQVLHRIAPQADEVFVYLNNLSRVPEECETAPDNVFFFTGPDLGDRGKFCFLEGFSGYYITVDDDIDYARYHIISLIDAIERYERNAIVGWHGSIFKEPFENFYDPRSRDVLSFRNTVKRDTPAHLLGTGTTGFHTDSIDIRLSDFEAPNMADAFLAVQAKRQSVKMIVLGHHHGQAVPLETTGSISEASLGKKDHNKERFDVRAAVTKLIQENGPWPTPNNRAKLERVGMRVAIVGRTNPKRWKKGGILKSCLLTRQMLFPYNCEIHMADIMDGDPIRLDGFDPDVVMVYVGDPERPDYKEVHKIVEHHAARGVPVLVNLSEDSHPQRTAVIARVMEEWQHRYKGLVRMMAFTPAVQNEPLYREFAHNIVAIPKTLIFSPTKSAEFESSNGIFVGDVAKLSDSRLVGGFVQEHIDRLREALPEATIYGVRQYTPRYEIPSGVDEVWPHLPADELAERLSNMRLVVNLVRYATYEMVPVEAAGLGIPVLYPNMPQSLNAALGLAGVQYTSAYDLASSAQLLYRDPLLWRQYSRAGKKMTQAQDFDLASAQMYMALKKMVDECKLMTGVSK